MLTAQEIEGWDCGGAVTGEGTMLPSYIEPGNLRRYVEQRGLRCEADFTDPASGEYRVKGYWLKAPHGARFYASLTPQGLVCFDTARQWCDGVEFASRTLYRRKVCASMS